MRRRRSDGTPRGASFLATVALLGLYMIDQMKDAGWTVRRASATFRAGFDEPGKSEMEYERALVGPDAPDLELEDLDDLELDDLPEFDLDLGDDALGGEEGDEGESLEEPPFESTGAVSNATAEAGVEAPADRIRIVHNATDFDEESYDPTADSLIDGPPLPTDRNETRIVYALARTDRSGEMIRDMVFARAYALSRNWTFGGVCPPRRTIRKPEEWLEARVRPAKDLLRNMGLSDAFAFRCPPGVYTARDATVEQRFPMTHKMGDDFPFEKYPDLIPYPLYYSKMELMTTSYRRHLRGLMMRSQPNATAAAAESDPYTILAHVRRGDIGPCDDKFAHRYLPNRYYIDAIERYKKKHSEANPDAQIRVWIYSETTTPPFEPLEEFAEMGYELRLDTPLEEAWWNIVMHSDVVILSKSSFSHGPALLADPDRTVVAYFPYRMKPAPEWDVASEEVVAETDRERDRLKGACPNATAEATER